MRSTLINRASGALVTVAVLLSLALGVRQAAASQSKGASCENCAGFGWSLECAICCGGPGFCSAAHKCLC